MPLDKLKVMEQEIEKAKELLKTSKDIAIASHNDADGICSSVILEKMIQRAGITPTVYHLEKTYREVIEKIYSRHNGIVILADLGSEKLQHIVNASRDGTRTIVMDHHKRNLPFAGHLPEEIINLNCEDYGIPGDAKQGDSNLTSATIAYLLAKSIDPDNADLSYLAVIGAIDDNGGLVGQDIIPFQDGFLLTPKNPLLQRDEGEVVVSWEEDRRNIGYESVKQIGEDTTLYAALSFFSPDNLKNMGEINRLKQALSSREYDKRVAKKLQRLWDTHRRTTSRINQLLIHGYHTAITREGGFVYVDLSSIIDTSQYASKYAGQVAEYIAKNTCSLVPAFRDVLVVMVGQNTRKDLPILGDVTDQERLKISYRLTESGNHGKVDLTEFIGTTKKALGKTNLSSGSHRDKGAITIGYEQKDCVLDSARILVLRY